MCVALETINQNKMQLLWAATRRPWNDSLDSFQKRAGPVSGCIVGKKQLLG